MAPNCMLVGATLQDATLPGWEWTQGGARKESQDTVEEFDILGQNAWGGRHVAHHLTWTPEVC